MSKELSYDFCIIPDPFSSGDRTMIFVAKTGDNFLNRNIVDNRGYMDIKEILEKFGYTETFHLQFESLSNPEFTIEEMKLFLEDCGLNYSRELEVNIIRDLTSLKNNTINNPHTPSRELIINKNTTNKLIESKGGLFRFKYKEPETSNKVTLYFYLFLEFGFNQFGRPMIQFGGDFNDSEDHDNRNYIKIVSSDFERVIDPSKPNAIVLKSCKTQSDFIREVGILYSGFFKYQRNVERTDSTIIQENKYPYKLAEVKKFLDPNQSIVVETNRMGYDKLITLSNRIKAEGVVELKQSILTKDIEREAEDLSEFLDKRMQVLSEHDQFEEAAKVKKDVEFIKNKIEYIKSLEREEISVKQYFKLFSIS